MFADIMKRHKSQNALLSERPFLLWLDIRIADLFSKMLIWR